MSKQADALKQTLISSRVDNGDRNIVDGFYEIARAIINSFSELAAAIDRHTDAIDHLAEGHKPELEDTHEAIAKS